MVRPPRERPRAAAFSRALRRHRIRRRSCELPLKVVPGIVPVFDVPAHGSGLPLWCSPFSSAVARSSAGICVTMWRTGQPFPMRCTPEQLSDYEFIRGSPAESESAPDASPPPVKL